MIGPDHFHANFYDVMPPFVLGVEEVVAFGDFGTRSGPLPVAADLAWSIRDGLAGDGFDLSLSYALTVDHGVVQTYDMLTGASDVPLVPLVVNTAAPPLPAMDRCVRARGGAGRRDPGGARGGRVLVAASGGLSHWLPSNDPRDPAIPGERRASVIHGRRDVARRRRRPRAAGARHGRRPERAGRAGLGPVVPRPARRRTTSPRSPRWATTRLQAAAGSGGHEVRTWLAGLAAVGEPLRWTAYEPVPEWITGMGVGSTFVP